ncbi:MAG TPA: metalloregulator ArsR/SmtB family transcription factor [Streptosporangiales bacterium]
MAISQESAFASARPVADLAVVPAGLPIAAPTALLLVDYAARLKPTPTPWPRVAAGRLPDRLLVEAAPLRAVLGHGDGLRCWLTGRIDPGDEAWTEWDAFRDELAGLSPAGVTELIEFGVHGNLRYADAAGNRLSEPAPLLLEAADGMGGEDRLPLRVQAVLTDWGVGDAARLAHRATDPAWFQDTLLRLLDGLWAVGFDEVWTRRPAVFTGVAAEAHAAAPGTTPEGWIGSVTGLRVDERWRWLLDRAQRVVVAPCPLLGRHMSVYDAGDATAYVLWEPAAERAPASRRDDGVDVGSLARLAPLATALGDATRLSILLVIARGDRPTAAQLANELELHPSTVSRQVTVLERVGLVTVTRDGAARRHELARDVVRRLCRTLEHALG